MAEADLVLAGGGLANGLIAWRLKQLRPELSVLLLEKGATLGGNHTWSFHSSDLTADELGWISPLISKSWSEYSVMFPKRRRTLSGGYHSIQSEHFHQILIETLGKSVVLGADILSVAPHLVKLQNGSEYHAACVIDGRGYGEGWKIASGYQKFLGLNVTVAGGHGLKNPLLMDVTCEQKDGFRFMYLLPWTEDSILIEDTHYSDTPDIDRPLYREEILAYARKRDWTVTSVDREEIGVLPLPLEGTLDEIRWGSAASVPCSGVRGGFFHCTTSYSLPQAIRVADAVAQYPSLQSESLADYTLHLAQQHWKSGSYFRLLNRLLFRAAKPENRYQVLEKFYGFSDGLIQRFYAGQMSAFDRAQVFTGKPPVPIHKAMRCFF